MVTQSRESIVTELRALQKGLKKHLRRKTLVIANKRYTMTELVARLERSMEAQLNVAQAKAKLAEALQRDRELRQKERAFLQALKVLLLTGEDAASLLDFGLAPHRKPRARTAEEQLLATAKNRATRIKRNTMGPKQKKAIKGTVIGVTVTPVTSATTESLKRQP